MPVYTKSASQETRLVVRQKPETKTLTRLHNFAIARRAKTASLPAAYEPDTPKKERSANAKEIARLRLFVSTRRFDAPAAPREYLSPLEQQQCDVLHEDLAREFGTLQGDVLLVTDCAGMAAARITEEEGTCQFDYLLTETEYEEFRARFDDQHVYPRYECFFTPVDATRLGTDGRLQRLLQHRPVANTQSYWIQESAVYQDADDVNWMRFLWAWDGAVLHLVDWLGFV